MKDQLSRAGILYIVSTPIGNLGDITYRAIETLKKVDYVLCEDTRVSGRLLSKYEIQSELISFNENNEDKKSPDILSKLGKGKNVAIISDAGTPLISDPGYKLVRESINNGIKVESIPGTSSVLTSLTQSGLPPDKFQFIGYLPKGEGKRLKILEKIKTNMQNVNSTTILFESPYRLIKTLHSIKEVFGDIDIVVCRELTKLFEEVRREKLSSSLSHFTKTTPKGEFIILI